MNDELIVCTCCLIKVIGCRVRLLKGRRWRQTEYYVYSHIDAELKGWLCQREEICMCWSQEREERNSCKNKTQVWGGKIKVTEWKYYCHN